MPLNWNEGTIYEQFTHLEYRYNRRIGLWSNWLFIIWQLRHLRYIGTDLFIIILIVENCFGFFLFW